ncbi:FISUMP domain-containing protein [uncultured Draconibacterium sp.]|uniref:FISUMP domain-containing protein n=1 Tax=uncultured Draconibacterium sp. TaxID=1573823 RepID=UPI0029C8250B|nr:FISUMP domain-containing protein [uncultured Draconibacterium sp.]
MKNKTFINVVILIFLIALMSCNNQRDKFMDLLAKKDLALAYDFKSKYPETIFNIDSLIQELEYEKVKSSNDVSELKSFKNKFPQSNYMTDILYRLSQIEWENLKKSWNVQSAQKYLYDYPDSPFCGEVEGWLFENTLNGTFTDKRDGLKYNWKKIGDQIWMTENLYFNADNSNSFGEGRAYSYSSIRDACIDGWDIPTIEEWYTLLFDLDTKVNMIDARQEIGLRGLVLFVDPSKSAIESVFNPYLKYDEVEYWTLGYKAESHFIPTRIRFSNGGYNLAYIGQSYGDRGYYPIRCIKKSTKPSLSSLKRDNLFSMNKNGLVCIDGIIYKSENLMNDGIYLPVGKNPDDYKEYKQSILIKYIGEKLFFFTCEGTGEHNDDLYVMKNLHVLTSDEKNHFKLAVLTNYNKRSVIGEFFIKDNSHIVLSMRNENPIEYILIRKVKVGFPL